MGANSGNWSVPRDLIATDSRLTSLRKKSQPALRNFSFLKILGFRVPSAGSIASEGYFSDQECAEEFLKVVATGSLYAAACATKSGSIHYCGWLQNRLGSGT